MSGVSKLSKLTAEPIATRVAQSRCGHPSHPESDAAVASSCVTSYRSFVALVSPVLCRDEQHRRLLRGAGRVAHGRREGDQEQLPQAGTQMVRPRTHDTRVRRREAEEDDR